jgi:hypothetical protein
MKLKNVEVVYEFVMTYFNLVFPNLFQLTELKPEKELKKNEIEE